MELKEQAPQPRALPRWWQQLLTRARSGVGQREECRAALDNARLLMVTVKSQGFDPAVSLQLSTFLVCQPFNSSREPFFNISVVADWPSGQTLTATVATVVTGRSPFERDRSRSVESGRKSAR